MTKNVTTSRRIYRITYYPEKWYRKASLVIRRLGVKGHKEFICRLKWGSSTMQSAYSSNSRLLDIICEKDPFFLRKFMLVNLDTWTTRRIPW